MTKQEYSTTYTTFITIQQVRILDIFIVAPFCFYVASQKTLPTPIRAGLIVLGATTLLFNGNNYLKNKN